MFSSIRLNSYKNRARLWVGMGQQWSRRLEGWLSPWNKGLGSKGQIKTFCFVYITKQVVLDRACWNFKHELKMFNP